MPTHSIEGPGNAEHTRHATRNGRDALALSRCRGIADSQVLLQRLTVGVDRRMADASCFRLSPGPPQRVEIPARRRANARIRAAVYQKKIEVAPAHLFERRANTDQRTCRLTQNTVEDLSPASSLAGNSWTC